MQDSIFTKIIRGEMPCHKVYEDEHVIAFLDIQPYTYGHTLVVPKQQVDHLWDVEDELYLHLMEVTKLVANRIREALRPKRVGMVLEGFAVPHAHVHVFPMNEGVKATVEHKVNAPTDKQLAEMAQKLAL